MVHALVQSISALEKEVAENSARDSNLPSSTAARGASSMTNERRKQLYSQLELALLDHELDNTVCDGEGGVLDAALADRIAAIRKSLKLQPIKRPRRWWYWLDVIYRFCGVCCGFFAISIVLSLPILVLQAVDDMLGIDPFHRMSEKLRKFCGQFTLLLSGIVYDVHGLDNAYFAAPCVVFAFTHASNLDGLLISATCPVRHYALAKKELFFVPFFSWISFAIGGIPVDRQNRDRAIGALRRCSERAASAKSCICIGPEGTRSTTGNLLPYKKGPFHIQSQLDAPIVPFVIKGGFDLYPVGSWVNQCGRVAVQYLAPIKSNDAQGKESMRRLCRRRVLEALASTPKEVGEDLSVWQWFSCYAANAANFCFVYLFIRKCSEFAFDTLKLTTQQAAGYSIAGTLGITFGLFVHFTYIVDLLDGMRSKSKSQDQKRD